MKFDFSGYATKNDIRCSDGRTIRHNAFAEMDGKQVPLVWQHVHNEPGNILGHAMLENRPDGVYAYATFNDSPNGLLAKTAVIHGDIKALSIFANQLAQQGSDVIHGIIRELSLVVGGANPGAFIDNIAIQHDDGAREIMEDQAIMFFDIPLEHSSLFESEGKVIEDKPDLSTLEHAKTPPPAAPATPAAPAAAADGADETVQDVFNTMNEKQKTVVYALIGQAIDDATNATPVQHNDQEGSYSMSRNVFDQTDQTPKAKRQTLTHSQIKTIMDDGVEFGSLKKSFLAHADEYGITDIDFLFPDAKTVGDMPNVISRQADWVPMVLGGVKASPFAKVKSLMADITGPQARAKGYVKGNEKTEEVLLMLRRTTGPTTVYKKQKLDRDDILDITDFDVIVWLKWEIRFMLNEELARAILIGDGRTALDADKIKDPIGAVDGVGIRSIANDSDLFAVKVDLTANVAASTMVDEITRSRSQYRGSGTPSMYTTDKILTDLLLQKDKMGRRIYDTVEALAAALRVKEIIPVEVMEEVPEVVAIIVNLMDYTIGSNAGGELTFFEDFDIDFNQNKYLLETRVSGGLTKPKSALVIRRELGTLVAVQAPSFNGTTNTITVPTVIGIHYMINDVIVTTPTVITEDTEVVAVPADGYYFAYDVTTSWTFTYTA